MRTIGLICEGPTDRAVLERLLAGVWGEDVFVNAVQPPHRMRPGVEFGGWLQVFASIERKDVSGALATNDLVVVQIDTDECEKENYAVSRREGGRQLDEAELAVRVQGRLSKAIEASDPAADLTRVVFAVCVGELECWLFLHISSRQSKTTGCLDAANRELGRMNCTRLGGKDAKNLRAYEDAARGLRQRKAVEALRGRAPSLDAFLLALDRHVEPPMSEKGAEG